jgi:hypothetical protein
VGHGTEVSCPMFSAQTAYPGNNVKEYKFVGETKVNVEQTKETYDFILQSQEEEVKIRANIIYNPNTDRIVSFDLKEM